MLRWVCVLSCVLAAGGCGGCGGLATDVLNHGCADAADCVVVDGDPCDVCGCATDAINVGAVDAFDALRADLVCGPVVDDDCECPTFVAV